MTTSQHTPGGLPRGRDIIDVWLGKATLHLIKACGLMPSAYDDLLDGSFHPGQAHAEDLDTRPAAFLARLDESLGSILCSAHAVEAAANSFVHASAYDAVLEPLSAPDKLSLAPPLVAHTDPFPPGSRLHRRLVHLFELSAELVRPWEQGPPGSAMEAAMFLRFDPLVALDALDAAATTIATLDKLEGAPYRSLTSVALDATAALRKRAEIAAAASMPTQVELDEEQRRAVPSFPPELIGA